MNDFVLMGLALELAAEAARNGEVPVGAVVAVDGVAISTSANDRERTFDPTGHAEILALRGAAQKLGRWRLSGACLYVTLEPCPMCAGALVSSRVSRLVYGADDPKAGAVRSLFTIADDPRLNHRVEVVRGLRAEEGSQLLSAFFSETRRRVRKGEY
ncbi:MAG: nucleoside deaminase [Deltaproteobacteria bacterium]|nr:nucleoside deaminase [Deltaproteobacteria bacterium]